jgi:hypothetical protein
VWFSKNYLSFLSQLKAQRLMQTVFLPALLYGSITTREGQKGIEVDSL